MSRKMTSSAPSWSYRAASSTGSPASRRPDEVHALHDRDPRRRRGTGSPGWCASARNLAAGHRGQGVTQADPTLVEGTPDDRAREAPTVDLECRPARRGRSSPPTPPEAMTVELGARQHRGEAVDVGPGEGAVS